MVLGKETAYPQSYSPGVLVFVDRKQESTLGEIRSRVCGVDLWNAYEFSFLDNRGSPEQYVLRIEFDPQSGPLVESKSLKLYLGGFAFERTSKEEVTATIIKDLKNPLSVSILPVNSPLLTPNPKIGYHIDVHTLKEPRFAYNSSLLRIGDEERSEVLYSDQFRSLCPVTGQPDWASVYVLYKGREIIPESLLSYLVSFRDHRGFHESCAEIIFKDIYSVCTPEELSIMCCFTRRGGIDINPIRTLKGSPPLRYQRTFRQ